MMTNFFRPLRGRKLLLLTAALTSAFVLAAVAHAAVREVGDTANFTVPACDGNECQVLTRTTAYQLQVGTRKNPNRVPAPGKVVAFSIYLPTVGKKQYTFFTDTYSGAPTASIAVLRPKRKRGVAYRYALVSQSERINLRKYLTGNMASFALAKSLSVKRGDIIAITTDTWMPSFTVVGQSSTSSWRASRPKGKCTAKEDLVTPRMHKKVDQIKQYGCGYTGARILYHATVVDDPKTR